VHHHFIDQIIYIAVVVEFLAFLFVSGLLMKAVKLAHFIRRLIIFYVFKVAVRLPILA
jgi:hypothetical protein